MTFIDELLSKKGAKKRYQCDKCSDSFDYSEDARQHSQETGHGIWPRPIQIRVKLSHPFKILEALEQAVDEFPILPPVRILMNRKTLRHLVAENKTDVLWSHPLVERLCSGVQIPPDHIELQGWRGD